MMRDPLAISRGLALTDAGLAAAGLDREARLRVWRGSLSVLASEAQDLGLGGWLMPGALAVVASLSEGPVLAELGWPDVAAGPDLLSWPIRRFGSMAW